jgi:Cys-tRNA(Pro)/Cys-tRNA(Cys) deacylase
MKTNAVRILESKKIYHQTFEYDVNEDELDAVSVAKKINADPEAVFKTLVTRNEKNELLVFVIPGDQELNLKKAALASSSKKIEMIRVKEIQNLTGYIRGGCSPIGMKKLFPTFIDETCEIFDSIFISAGMRGMQIKVAPAELISAIGAKTADLI